MTYERCSERDRSPSKQQHRKDEDPLPGAPTARLLTAHAKTVVWIELLREHGAQGGTLTPLQHSVQAEGTAGGPAQLST